MTTAEGAETGTKTSAAIEAENADASDQRRTQPGAKLGVKSAADVAAQTAPTGPLISYGARPPVREGAKVGYKGEAEGLVSVSEGDRQTVKATILEGQAAGPFAPGGRAPASREGDYLADERSGPVAPSGDPSPPAADPAPGAGGTLPATDPAGKGKPETDPQGRPHVDASLTRAELDAIAAAEGVDVSGAANKGEVVDAIKSAREAAAS